MNLTPFVVAWICLGMATLVLAAYRKYLSTHEDDYIHVEEWAKAATDQQAAAARKFERIDRWGEGLTILMAVAGVLLGAFYLYQAWLHASH
jgi:hypothetical protein